MNSSRAPERPPPENREIGPATNPVSKHAASACTQAAILPLPAEVIARIKSSTTITTLTGGVLGLVKNALDAEANKVDITVDFRRGSCAVEDNGVGIAPAEFGEDASLGKMYYTSKHGATSATHGFTGTFLASLSALSLLTITSHHHLHRSTNTVTFHHSKAISRLSPTLPQHELSFREHGTRVTVRDLFGNMPVRIKHRALLLEERAELDKLWETLKRRIVGLVLAWSKPVTLRVREQESNTSLTLPGVKVGASTALAEKDVNDVQKRPASSLHLILSTLAQASLISPEGWKSWVPISASTLSVSVKGAISLEPAPSRHVQFISVGIQPLYVDAGHNELYSEINRLFNLSDFGAMEEEPEIDEVEKERRKNDRRYKTDGFTNRQMRGGRKGIDRWPMFCLKITIRDPKGAVSATPDPLDSESRLQSVIEVLGAMVTQWLSVHHFRPRKRGAKNATSRPGSAATTDSTATDTDTSVGQHSSRQKRAIQAVKATSHLSAPETTSLTSSNRKRKRSGGEVCKQTSADSLTYSGIQSFNGWSRIKSGNAAFYDNLWSAKKPSSAPAPRREGPDQLEDVERTSTNHNAHEHAAAVFNTEPIVPGQLGASAQSSTSESPTVTKALEIATGAEDADQGHASAEGDAVAQDGTKLWTDPATKEVFLINARTGAAVPRPERTCSASTTSRDRATLRDFHRPLRIAPKIRSSSAERPSNTWINGFLAAWDNPVFRPTEKEIPQVSSDYLNTMPAVPGPAVKGLPSSNGGSRLSKNALSKAKIIAQVDKKFILARMDESQGEASSIQKRQDAKQLLILIDQHAADERCRVEQLFADLCTQPSASSSPYRSKAGHTSSVRYEILLKPLILQLPTQECHMFETYASHFAAWGILYDLTPADSASTPTGEPSGPQQNLVIRTLPPAIAERCKMDPKLLISLLRSEIWKLSESHSRRSTREPAPTLPTTALATNSTSAAHHANLADAVNTENPWLRQIGSCPQGMLDMLNSRACRSAVMFNDVMSLEQCEALVSRLAECAFPFQCAHGRPSMVPLVGLGTLGGVGDGLGLGVGEEVDGRMADAGVRGFVEAFGAWRRREEGTDAGEGVAEGEGSDM